MNVNDQTCSIPRINFVWNRCPTNVDDAKKYAIYESDPRIVSKANNSFHATVTGSSTIPYNTIVTWDVKIVSLMDTHGRCSTLIGVAPLDISPSNDNFNNKYGWYVYCIGSKLYSSAPHNFKGKEFRQVTDRKKKSISTGDVVTLMMDTVRGNLSFSVNGEPFVTAYEGIPLEKPLVPCVVIGSGNTIELNPPQNMAQMNPMTSPAPSYVTQATGGGSLSFIQPSQPTMAAPAITIPVPTNISTKSDSWDSITIRWDEVRGAAFYQVEVDWSQTLDMATTNVFVKRGLPPDSEYSFRVRAGAGDNVSGWSDVVKGTTQKIFGYSGNWKDCPYETSDERKYAVKSSSGVATKVNSGMYGESCTIIGNAPLPIGQVLSWNVKVARTWGGEGVYVGVATSDIKQNVDGNFNRCGWYYCCYNSMLVSGPPHNCKNKEYGLKKGDGKYIKDGDTVGVLIDTTKGEISFILNGENLGVAFVGVPLVKPLVPCVLLSCYADSVELVI